MADEPSSALTPNSLRATDIPAMFAAPNLNWAVDCANWDAKNNSSRSFTRKSFPNLTRVLANLSTSSSASPVARINLPSRITPSSPTISVVSSNLAKTSVN